jgi:uncharacterized delta-60 repeat protein
VFSQTPGDLDLGFSHDGKVIVDYGDLDHCEDVVIDSLENIYFAGYTTFFTPTTNTDFVVGKINAAGAVDSTFGLNGFYIGDFPKANTSTIHNIELVADGILLFGSGIQYGVADTQYLYVQKIDYSGSLDTTFADSGTFSGVFLSSYNFPGDMEVLPDGKIIVCGSAYDSLTVQDAPLIGRLLTNGEPDTTFSPSGFKYWDLTGPLQDANNIFANMPEHGAGGFLDDVIVMPNGNFFFSGFYDSGTTIHCLMLMLNSDGNFVSNFALGGYQIFQNNPLYSNKITKSVYFNNQLMLGIQLDGAPTHDFLVQPIDTLGNFGTILSFDFSGQRDNLKTMYVKNDELFLAGYSTLVGNIGPGYESDFFTMAKLDTLGNLDTQFANGGQFLEDFSTNDEAGSTSLFEKNGKVVVGGYVNNVSGNNITDFGFMRVHNSSAVGIENEISHLKWCLFPNPTSGRIRIQGNEEIQKVSIRNVTGKLIVSQNSIQAKEISLNLTGLVPGTYMVFISCENSNVTKKLIIN